MDQQETQVLRPAYRAQLEDIARIMDGKISFRGDVFFTAKDALGELIHRTPEYREVATDSIRIAREPDGTWRAWLTPEVQVVGSFDCVSTEVHVAMRATEFQAGRTSTMVGGYRVIDRRHGDDRETWTEPLPDAISLGVDLAGSGGDRAVGPEDAEILYEALAKAQEEIARLKHDVRENQRKITNLRNERNQARKELEEEKAKPDVYFCDACLAEFSCPGEVLDHSKECDKHPLGKALKAAREWEIEAGFARYSADLWRDRVEPLEREKADLGVACDKLIREKAELVSDGYKLITEKNGLQAELHSLVSEHDKVCRHRDQLEETCVRLWNTMMAISRRLPEYP